MCDIDGEPPELGGEMIWRRANKQHPCSACCDPIAPKEMYRLIRGRWDGDWETFKQCARCAKIWDVLNSRRRCGEPGPQLDLGCGEVYEGSDLDWLAFTTRDEGQQYAKRQICPAPL